jgi:hypothetical protein
MTLLGIWIRHASFQMISRQDVKNASNCRATLVQVTQLTHFKEVSGHRFLRISFSDTSDTFLELIWNGSMVHFLRLASKMCHLCHWRKSLENDDLWPLQNVSVVSPGPKWRDSWTHFWRPGRLSFKIIKFRTPKCIPCFPK